MICNIACCNKCFFENLCIWHRWTEVHHPQSQYIPFKITLPVFITILPLQRVMLVCLGRRFQELASWAFTPTRLLPYNICPKQTLAIRYSAKVDSCHTMTYNIHPEDTHVTWYWTVLPDSENTASILNWLCTILILYSTDSFLFFSLQQTHCQWLISLLQRR